MGLRTKTPGTNPPTKLQLHPIEPKPQPLYTASIIQEEATEETRDQRTNQEGDELLLKAAARTPSQLEMER